MLFGVGKPIALLDASGVFKSPMGARLSARSLVLRAADISLYSNQCRNKSTASAHIRDSLTALRNAPRFNTGCGMSVAYTQSDVRKESLPEC
jgi:hypothetical protein